jgi:hypothetical protein
MTNCFVEFLFVVLFSWASVYCSLTGLLYRPLWTFQLWPPDAPAPIETYGRRRTGKFCLNADFHGTFRDLLHAANLRHRTHGFTSLPKEGFLRNFPPLKIRALRPSFNPRTWVPEASPLTPRPPKPLSWGYFTYVSSGINFFSLYLCHHL